MTEDDIDVPGRRILLRGEKTKTRRTRLIQHIPDTAFEWVEAHGFDPTNRVRRIRQISGDTHWIQDGCRHSFMTYMVASGKVTEAVLAAGHLGTQVAMRHYVSLTVGREDAEAYFGVRP